MARGGQRAAIITIELPYRDGADYLDEARMTDLANTVRWSIDTAIQVNDFLDSTFDSRKMDVNAEND